MARFCYVQQSTMTDTTAKNGSKMEKREIGILKTTYPDSPYFLHSSDDPGRVLVTTSLFEENYHTWRRSMQNALFAKNKMGYVDGSFKTPNTDSPEYQAWTKCNSMVLSWLLNALSRDLQGSVAYVESAAEVWNDLHEHFSLGNASRILSTEPLPSLNKVYAMTTKEEKQQAVAASRSPIIEATALAAKMNHTGKSSMSGKPRCDHCKKVGHTKERCYEIIGYPVGWKIGPAKMKGKGEHQKHQHQEKELIFAANTSHESQMAGDSLDQSPIAGLSKIIDSGASDHMTPNISILQDIKPYSSPVHIPDGTTLEVSSIGKTVLPNKLTLNNVLHVPQFACNLLSISKITEQLNCAVIFFPDFYVFQDLASRKLIGMGKLHRG
ncbi:hypothetical protein SLEP1_g10205 [Rubroshorea leprosula]|uniref:Retrotransposon Copia-like N-terminal domain-containing protein n=1 Tax=Rubroshorea leprosula TaxID=152421 RepID=A0AAV5IGS4_9ROSI|nr:hypothetical protein SLEP1_g10205 [Rubroshorea leprosula]